jgi:hypothetical protein
MDWIAVKVEDSPLIRRELMCLNVRLNIRLEDVIHELKRLD